jgi:hypothetical protein
VGGQVAAFAADMRADSAAQAAECRALVDAAVRRAGKLVDDTLQVVPPSFSPHFLYLL